MPVGYPLSELFSHLDYAGMELLYEGLRPYADGEPVRLRLVYPPPPPGAATREANRQPQSRFLPGSA